jgi:TolB protein
MALLRRQRGNRSRGSACVMRFSIVSRAWPALGRQSMLRPCAERVRKFAIGSAVVAVAAVCGASAARAQRPGIALSYQLTHVDQGEPFFSPDGKKVVYETTVAGFEQVFTMNADGTGPMQITHDAVNHDSPAWSPDGKKIAFVSDKGGGEAIYIMDVDGTGQERMTNDEHRYIHPNWSADSTQLIFCTDDDLKPPKKNASAVYSLNIETKQLKTLISGGTNTYPSWSPDGKKIAFRRMLGERNSEVFVADRDGSNQRNLTNHPAFDGWPSWSPDGKQLVFASNRRSNYQIFIMNADGSNVRLVANTEGRATEPRWSPDGKSIYFTDCKAVDWGYDCEIFVTQIGPTAEQAR